LDGLGLLRVVRPRQSHRRNRTVSQRKKKKKDGKKERKKEEGERERERGGEWKRERASEREKGTQARKSPQSFKSMHIVVTPAKEPSRWSRPGRCVPKI